MYWRGEFYINGELYHNEILATGLTFLGGVLSNGAPAWFGAMRLEDGTMNEIITKNISSSTFTTDVNELTVECVAEFTQAEMVAQAEFAVLISNTGVDIARAPILAAANRAVIVTRRDIFEVNL